MGDGIKREKGEIIGCGFPVFVGPVPLLAVTSFSLTEGYDKVAIAGSSLVQLVRPKTKKIKIKALLPSRWRALRPVLEALAMTSRSLAAITARSQRFTGVWVVTRTSVSLDMQITSLVFTQDSQTRDTLSVDITLEQAPRSRLSSFIGEGADFAMAVAKPYIP